MRATAPSGIGGYEETSESGVFSVGYEAVVRDGKYMLFESITG